MKRLIFILFLLLMSGVIKVSQIKEVSSFLIEIMTVMFVVPAVGLTKLAKFFEEKVTPFAQKHSKVVNAARNIAPLGILVGSIASEVALADSLSEDIKEKAGESVWIAYRFACFFFEFIFLMTTLRSAIPHPPHPGRIPVHGR